MAKTAARTPGPTTTILNENEAPSVYTNHCELGIIGGEFRITFREALKATSSEIVVREMVRVYFNITVARQLAKMLEKAVSDWDSALPSAKASAKASPASD